MKISVIIPIYNSQPLIQQTADQLSEFLDRTSSEYEILFRDDGSNDQSMSTLSEVSARYPNVRCFSNQENQGLGITLRHLFQEAKGEVVLYTDCDLPFGVDIIGELLEQGKEYDVVLASRYKKHTAGIPFLRRLASRIYYSLCYILFNISVLDIGSGCVLLKRTSIEKLNLQSKGFDIHVEIYAKALQQGLSILEIPADFRKIKTGSFSIARHGPSVVISTFRLWREMQRRPKVVVDPSLKI